ncbi:M56 family metallopeptidase [Mucilaginibacter terrigena]|uniref:M56 family metallopeptidase n=1 Tax=Mucilaginibacter terrigena TaxID=2492395 RepID=A0A4Q5LIZ4_9SPHI|nr:M56 family metallopeptidase [Mucilaginibacter terrigena]RYU89348.1 M56 family metallopeptidase [Mucilaginibacter terrigena]
MIPYVLHVALLIGVCLLFYKVLLQKETFYHLNRWVLLACLAVTFLLPLIRVPQQWAFRKAQEVAVTTPASVIPQGQLKTPVVETTAKQPATVASPTSVVQETAVSLLPQLLKWTLWLYWCGVAAFGLNFLLQVLVLVRQAYKSPFIQDGQFRIVELDTDKAPCSFGNYIFINPEKYDWETYSQILLHEKIHIKQGHSFDLLLAELMLVFQWFNPFAWLYRKELENNLEFLTDSDVLTNNEVERELYQMSLLKVSVPNLSLRITTNYNQSLLKKRIVMMNAKRSNIHTTWKYFFLLPLMAFLMCAFNEPTASRRPMVLRSQTTADTSFDPREGVWKGTITGTRIRMEFRSKDEDHNSRNSNEYTLSEFTSLPKGTPGDFKLIREAGTMNLNGKFDGNTGSGHYKFTGNPGYYKYMESQGITGIDKNDELAFFMINIKKEFVAMLQRKGFKNVSKNDLIALAALGVNEQYIVSLKQNGFPHASANDLITGKAMGINGAFINEIRKAGYPNVSFDKLVSFKAQGINGQYISKFKSAKAAASGKGKTPARRANNPDADDMIAYKALNVDEAYVTSLKNAGYTNLSTNDLIAMKSVGVTPEFIKSFKNAGFTNISHDNLVSMKALGITPEYLNSFKNAGFTNITPDKAAGLKSLGVTPEFIKSFKSVGFDNVSLDNATALKALGITPEYISQMREKGFKSDDINKYITLKSAF